MPQASRENIYTALFNLLNGAYAWALSSRRIFPLAQMAAASQQPAMMLAQWPSEKAEQNKAWGLTKWQLKAQCLVYFRVDITPDGSIPPAATGNVILDAIESALNPNIERQSLGGLVENCWIDGEIVHVDGSDDGQGLLIIPISILSGG